jgi:hypothetical protein
MGGQKAQWAPAHLIALAPGAPLRFVACIHPRAPSAHHSCVHCLYATLATARSARKLASGALLLIPVVRADFVACGSAMFSPYQLVLKYRKFVQVVVPALVAADTVHSLHVVHDLARQRLQVRRKNMCALVAPCSRAGMISIHQSPLAHEV